MIKRIEYKSANGFMFACVMHDALPAIHWREGFEGYRGSIWFKVNENYLIQKGEIHIFYSSDKKLLDAIWNSIGLIKHAVKLVHEV